VAAWGLLRAQRALEEAKAEMQDSIVGLYLATPGILKCQVGEIIRSDLTLHGFQPEQVARLAVSDASIRLILDGTRRPA
jgi:hypothetical protein